MAKINQVVIEKVEEGSPAAAAGIKEGWKLLRIDNENVVDIIDYKIMESDDQLRLLLMTERGILRRVKINKNIDTPLGLKFNPPTIDKMQRCSNKCVFCFVDQNPSGMRSALYIKDDDYRLSFLYGNFITLNRVSAAEVERIIKLRLSPLYVSVHTTNPALRNLMFGTKKAEKGLSNLRLLVQNGIQIHAQIVLCPGYNTGLEMSRTIEELAKMGSGVASVALVPVGLTAHRSKCVNLRKFTGPEAVKLLAQLENMQLKFLKERGTRFVYAADEFYNQAATRFPDDEQYEGYPQLENGVGLARHFLDELKEVEEQEAASQDCDLKITIATGVAAKSLMEELLNSFSAIKGLTIDLKIIENNFFGKQVTVSGLLTGSDLLRSLEGKDLGDMVFINKTMLKEDSSLFLDDLTLENIEQGLNKRVYAVSGPLELLAIIRDYAGGVKSESKGVRAIDR